MFIRYKGDYAYLVKTYYDKGKVKHWQKYIGMTSRRRISLYGYKCNCSKVGSFKILHKKQSSLCEKCGKKMKLYQEMWDYDKVQAYSHEDFQRQLLDKIEGEELPFEKQQTHGFKTKRKNNGLRAEIEKSKFLTKEDKREANILLDEILGITPKQKAQKIKKNIYQHRYKAKKNAEEWKRLGVNSYRDPYLYLDKKFNEPRLALYEAMAKMGLREGEDFVKHFKKMALKLHPDVGGDEKEFKKLLDGYRAYKQMKEGGQAGARGSKKMLPV